MQARLRERLEFMNGLGFRLGFLLSIAILPIGLISLLQTLSLSREVEHAGELSLLGRTAAAAAGERALVQGALGAADALGPAVLDMMEDPEACSAMMKTFVTRNATYVFAGFTRMDGVNICNSSGQAVDLTTSPVYRSFLKTRSTTLSALDRGPVSQRSVVVVAQPLYRDRELLGYTSVSMTHDLLRSTHSSDLGGSGANIVTFGNDGTILSTYQSDSSEVDDLLPRSVSLAELADGRQRTFHDADSNGTDRMFAVVPIVPGLAYALGSYTLGEAGSQGVAAARIGAIVIPLALWAVSIGVAYLAVYRLVLRHVRELRGQMRRFAVGDREVLPRVIPDAPAELKDVSRTFHNMARILVRDEKQLEEAVNEKTILLKEVHHRVKNNLQLIASIINMQTRTIDDADAKRVLRSLQDRVASLATIYRNLYQAEHLDSVEADRLLGDIVGQMSSATGLSQRPLRIETDIRPLTLLPDQAVPLSLLATEVMTNAVKYAAPAPGQDRATIRVTLVPVDGSRATFMVTNSMGGRAAAHPDQGTGLGGQLIEAFAMQLNGEAEIDAQPDSYSIGLTFPVQSVEPRQPPQEVRGVVLTSAARAGATH